MTAPPAQGSLRSWLWVAFVSGEDIDDAVFHAGTQRTDYDLARLYRWWAHWCEHLSRLYGMREIASRRHGEIGKAQRRRRSGGHSRSSLATRWR